MPKGYVIVNETVHDPAGMEAYMKQAALARTGRNMRTLVFDDNSEVLEGEWPHRRTLVIEFDSVEDAKDWYECSEYQAAIPIRQAAATANIMLVAGFEPPS